MSGDQSEKCSSRHHLSLVELPHPSINSTDCHLALNRRVSNPTTRNRTFSQDLRNLRMDSLLPQLLAFPPHPTPQPPLSDAAYDEGIRAQISTLKKLSEKNLLQHTSGGESPLNVS